jgi:zinc protease
MSAVTSPAVRSLLAATMLAACGSTSSTTQPAPLVPPGPTEPPPTDVPPTDPPETFPVQTATPQALAFPDEAFRATKPAAGPPRPFGLPAMKPLTLKNGIKVYLVERHDLPLISLDLNFDGGALVDPPGKEGLAAACMDLVTEGTTALDKVAFSAALADRASSISSYAGDDSQGVAMDALSANFEPTLALMADSIRSPGLREADFQRLIARRIEAIKQSKGSPASLAARVQDRIYFGDGSPEGALVTEASLAAITLDDCRTYAATWLKPKNARLFVVGDLTAEQVRAAFEGGAFAGWTGAAPTPPTVPAPKPLDGRIFFVDVRGAAQSQVVAMHGGPARTAKDFFANSMMSTILGGGFSSRINMNLREDKGYAYGARGGFAYSRRGGVFTAGASVRTDASYQSLLELHREISAMQTGDAPATAAELERERQGAILSLPSRFATGNAALGTFRGLVYYGLPLTYYNSYVAQLGKVTTAQLAASAKTHLRPKALQYLVVGDGEAPVIVRDGKENVPLLKDGKPVTLRQALADLAASGGVGAGALVELDADAQPVGR